MFLCFFIRAEIEKLCDEIDTMAAGLAALQARGEVTHTITSTDIASIVDYTVYQ